MKYVYSLIFVVLALCSGCESKSNIELTKEQAVYETLFLEIFKNAHSKYYLVEATESYWFTENPFSESDWIDDLSDLGDIDIDIIKKLYENNEASTLINWIPFITNASLLPSRYVTGSREDENNCFVNKEDSNVGIFKGGKGYRAYYTVSNVAFSRDANKAIVKYSRHCAPMSGAGGFFVVFQFIENQWKVIGGRRLWIS
jgi:hypothetical protein